VSSGDFDQNGIDDLAIGVPGEDLGQPGDPGFVEDAGAAQVLYGSVEGIETAGNQLWTQDSEGILGVAETGDLFGSQLVSGDFDGDGDADLSVAAVGETVVEDDHGGSVVVIYGTPAGLTSDSNQYLTQDSQNIADAAEPFDLFGAALAAGDFDLDGFDDLAVGVPGEDVGATEDAGAIHVVMGGSSGLLYSDSQFWTQDSPNVKGVVAEGDRFGGALGAGNTGRSAHEDLAIGVPNEAVANEPGAGGVNFFYGSRTGLDPTDDQFWSQHTPDVEDEAEMGDGMGSSLVTG
jgi:hypothetical protein